MTKISSDSPKSRLLAACLSFMVPVARFLLRSGLSFDEFSNVVQLAFVSVASEDYGLRGRETNASRVSAMTGISRRDVTRLREQLRDYRDDPRGRVSPVGDVLHTWHTLTKFRGANGFPLALAVDGADPSFESLVELVAPGLPAGAMKTELLRCGAIEELPGGLLRVCRRSAIPDAVDQKLCTSMMFNLRGLCSTIAHNSNPARREPGRIERFVYSPPFTATQKRVARESLRARIRSFSVEIDDQFEVIRSSEKVVEPDSGRVGMGIYYFEDD